MRTLAVILNCFVLLSMLVVFFVRPAKTGVGTFIFCLAFLLINLIALMFGDYGERKKLEETKTTDTLANNTKTQQDKDK